MTANWRCCCRKYLNLTCKRHTLQLRMAWLTWLVRTPFEIWELELYTSPRPKKKMKRKVVSRSLWLSQTTSMRKERLPMFCWKIKTYRFFVITLCITNNILNWTDSRMSIATMWKPSHNPISREFWHNGCRVNWKKKNRAKNVCFVVIFTYAKYPGSALLIFRAMIHNKSVHGKLWCGNVFYTS